MTQEFVTAAYKVSHSRVLASSRPSAARITVEELNGVVNALKILLIPLNSHSAHGLFIAWMHLHRQTHRPPKSEVSPTPWKDLSPENLHTQHLIETPMARLGS